MESRRGIKSPLQLLLHRIKIKCRKLCSLNLLSLGRPVRMIRRKKQLRDPRMQMILAIPASSFEESSYWVIILKEKRERLSIAV